MKIAALFVDINGIYSTFENLDLYDIKRDARSYCDNYPVVAHPPCNLWGKFAIVNYVRWGGDRNKPGNDKGCFESALYSVRRCGGVLEHPANSKAWDAYSLIKLEFGKWTPSDIGFVTEVWQSAYGHQARKKTWLYYVGANKPYALKWDRTAGTHQIGRQDQRGKDKNKPTISGKKLVQHR